ncbi:transitional endoplasmic reticulum ATPase-like isoform X1 [Daphnia pulex]|uniref:transitional endoplasmic reticulum ATPase-like isoform X1 n=1 Tax=Daphnia pulex TaxID=6669 RepID=UPI001EDE86C0|nr:transitional endoplasmic reticulum ATPase-like isoform X1 [Daphnia pulex]
MDEYYFESGKLPMSIANKQFDPVWLTVENDLNEDGVVYLSKEAIDSLELSSGDSVLIKGKQNKETVSIPHADDAIIDFNEIRMDSSIRDYLRVSLGDKVLLSPVKYNKFGKIIHALNEDYAMIAKSDVSDVDGLVKELPNLELGGPSGDTSDVDKNVDEKKLVLFNSVVVPVPDTVSECIVEVQSQREKEERLMKPNFEEIMRFCAII